MRKDDLPNLITLSRLLVVPFGIYVHATLNAGDIPGAPALLVLVWLIAGDYLDGFLARRWHAESDLGRLIDPAVDKTFLTTMLIVYALSVDSAVLWASVAMRLLPDLLTLFVGLAEAATRKVEGSAFWGKRKTDTDFVALLIAYTPVLLSGDTSSYRVVIGVLAISTALGFVAFGYYLRRFLTSYAGAGGDGRPAWCRRGDLNL